VSVNDAIAVAREDELLCQVVGGLASDPADFDVLAAAVETGSVGEDDEISVGEPGGPGAVPDRESRVGGPGGRGRRACVRAVGRRDVPCGELQGGTRSRTRGRRSQS